MDFSVIVPCFNNELYLWRCLSAFAARNRGVRQARGEVLVFTDSDCEVCPTWLEEIAASLAEPGAALVLGSVSQSGRRYG